MIALGRGLPGESAGVRTPAPVRPITALSTATRSEITSVFSSAVREIEFDTDVQKSPSPVENALSMTAATGISTNTLRYSIDSPQPSWPAPPKRSRARCDRAGVDGPLGDEAPSGVAYESAGGSWDPRRLLDLDHRAVGRIEELIVHLRPAAEAVHGEQLRDRRERAGELLGDARQDRPVALLPPQLLRGGRQQPVDVRLGLRQVA